MKNNWQTKKIGEVCSIVKGKKPTLYKDQKENVLPYLGARFMRGLKDAEYASVSDKNSVVVAGKDLIIICDGSKSGDMFSGFKGILSSTMGKINFNEREINSNYLKRFLDSNFDLFNGSKKGAAIPHLDFHLFNNLEIPLPPLEEQKKIVKMLDEKMGKIAEAKRLRAEALADTEKILSQTLHEIFEEGKKNEWEEKTIDSISKVGTGATPLKGNSKYYGGDIPWVTSKATSNTFVSKANDFITDLALKETNCKINPTHTLLVAMYGEGKTRGQVSELLIEATTNQAIATVLVDENKINRTFVKYFFVYNYEAMRQMAEGGPQLNLNLSKIKKMKISFPSLIEQQKIVTKLDALSEKVRILRDLQTTQLADLKSLERAYLREAFMN